MSGINLKELIENYPDCLNSASKLKGYLMDLYPDAGARLGIIATIYDCGIVAEIKRAAAMDELTLSSYVARLEDFYGYSPRLSKECLKLWGEVYGIAAPVDESFVLETSKEEVYINPADFVIEDGILKEYNGSGGKVIIPDSVTYIGDFAFADCSSLTSITIPDNVIAIGESAFDGCSSLTSITIPSNIEDDAFNGCSSLTSITILSGVASIGDYAFNNCSRLTSITIPDSVTTIGSRAFAGCSNLTSITIPNSVTFIGCELFFGCSSLTSIAVKRGNTEYDSRDNCNAIIESASDTLVAGCKNTVIPDSVEEIYGSAFAGCSSLTSITIPANVRAIGEGAFDGCEELVVYAVPGSYAERYSKENGITVTSLENFEARKEPHEKENTQGEIDSLTLSNEDFEIENGLLKKYKGQRSFVTIPNGVTSIGKAAFLLTPHVPYSSSNLESLVFPDGVRNIGAWAFEGCRKLKDLALPESVTSIGEWAFWRCSSLKNLVLPESVMSIGESAFYGCSKLESLSIPNSVESIEDKTFLGCRNLMSIILPNSVTNIGGQAFYGCKGLTSITIPDSVTRIGDKAFDGCELLAIHAPRGSYAEKYAKENNIPFSPL